MSDGMIEVQISADVKDMLQGMQEAKESVETAVEGMRGDLGSMIESFETFGVSATLGVAAAGLAFEGLKEVGSYVVESAAQTKELSESFKTLGYATGASLGDMNAYSMAIEMSGGKVGDLDHLMVGMQRGIKANSEALIANGVAANEAALKGMTFEQYLTKVSEIADEMATPTDREQFLIQALGRSGAMAGQQIKEFVEHLKEGHDLADKGGIVTPKALEQLEESKAATARLEIAQQKYAAAVSSSWTPISNWFSNMHAKWLETSTDHAIVESYLAAHLIDVKLLADGYTQDIPGMIAEVQKLKDTWKDVDASSSDAGVHNGPKPGEKHDQGKPAKEKGADPMAKWETELSTQKAMLAQADGDMAQMSMQAERDFWASKLALTRQGSADWVNIRNRMAEEGRAISKAATDAENAQAKAQEKEVEKWEKDYLKTKADAVKEAQALAKEQAREETQAAKDGFTEKRQTLDQEVALGRMTAEQRLAAEVTLRSQEKALEEKALTDEQMASAISSAKWKELEDKKLDLARKTENEITQLRNQAEVANQQKWQQGVDKMTSGWDRGIQEMLHHQMTFSQGFKSAAQQMEDQFEKSVINMGLQWVKGMLLQMVASKTAHESQNLMDAKSAAGGAYNAIVGIPYVGPVLAPIAAGVAFAGVMAFAEGGWDQVPSDQVAMIHKNEMVLPASLAEGVRQNLGGGSGSGAGKTSDMHLHIHGAADAKSFLDMVKRNQGGLMGIMQEAAKNRRTS